MIKKLPKPKINLSKCSGEGSCVDVCPVGVYEIKNKKSTIVNSDVCIGCRACEVQCPNSAIVIED
jgi:NAD-dependent dihydropyrimidine dehydrogenase PreA subunit